MASVTPVWKWHEKDMIVQYSLPTEKEIYIYLKWNVSLLLNWGGSRVCVCVCVGGGGGSWGSWGSGSPPVLGDPQTS